MVTRRQSLCTRFRSRYEAWRGAVSALGEGSFRGTQGWVTLGRRPGRALSATRHAQNRFGSVSVEGGLFTQLDRDHLRVFQLLEADLYGRPPDESGRESDLVRLLYGEVGRRHF